MKVLKTGFSVIILLSLWFSPVAAFQVKWYQYYDFGQQAMRVGKWEDAAKHFQEALKVRNRDKHKMRVGTMFIEYYPHRELGICYYHLGQHDLARKELLLSLRQAPTDRAKLHLARLPREGSSEKKTPDNTGDSGNTSTPPDTGSQEPPTPPDTTPRVGERLRIALLSFENKGAVQGYDLFDKIITAFVRLDRFKVLERAQLEKVMKEHELNFTGFIDAATAVEIGKGVGVDAVVIGSVNWTPNSASIDARFIDTETAAIISAQNAFCARLGEQGVITMLDQLASKINSDLPVVTGYVISVDDSKVMLDLGHNKGMKKGMKCFIYREGDAIIHPVTKKVLGKEIDILSEIQLSEVYEEYSVGHIIIEKAGTPLGGDRAITR
ncbi:hypothetical protein JXJ21_09810 [candidate division KSB1 bacterium]|nr:hypothetical protein [candidate division KSB1 bacterium]